MSHTFKVKDNAKGVEKDVVTFKDVLSFMVAQTAHLMIQSHLTTDELIKLQWLEHNSGEMTLLNRFEVSSQIGA